MMRPSSHLRHICIAAVAVLTLLFLSGVGRTTSARPLSAPHAAPLQQQGTVTFTFANDAATVPIGGNTTVNGTLQYTGNVTDTFNVSFTIAQGWSVTVSPGTTITLGPGQPTVQLSFLVQAPATTTTGTNLTVTVRSPTSGLSGFDSITLNVPTPTNTPGPPAIDVVLRAGEREREVAQGNTVIYELRVRNIGTQRVTVDLAFDPTQRCSRQITDCTEEIDGAVTGITIDPNTSRDFNVEIFIPSSASPNQRAETRVFSRVTSPATPSVVEDSIVLVTTVLEATPTATRTSTPSRTPTPSATLAPVCRDKFEDDDARGSARVIEVNLPQPEKTPISGDQDDRRAICPAGDEDWLVFGGIAGKIYTIDIFEMATGLDLTLELFDQDGTSLAFNDDFFNRDPNAPNTNDLKPRIESWRAPSTQRYYIRVRDAAAGGGTDFVYFIIVRGESFGPTPETVTELCEDQFEPDGLPEQARLLTSNERQLRRRLCPTGDADWITFFGKKDKRYFIYTQTEPYVAGNPVNVNEGGDRVAPGSDTVLVLADRDGVSVLDVNDDIPGGNTLDSQIEFVPEVDGFYYAQIKNVGDIGSQFIFYDLTLELCVGPDIPCGRPISFEAEAPRPTSNIPTPTFTPTATPEGEFSLDGTATATPEEQ